MRMAMSLSAALMFASPAVAQETVIDPEWFSDRQQFAGAPHYVREGRFARHHLPDHWPFKAEEGTVVCVSVDSVALALFEAGEAEEPFMLGENMFMTFIGTSVTGARGYLRDDIEPARLVEDLEAAYQAALVRCGPPYAQ